MSAAPAAAKEPARLEASGRLLMRAAEAAGLACTIEPNAGSGTRARLRIHIGTRDYVYWGAVLSRLDREGRPHHVNGPAITLTRSKAATKALLAAAGVPVPRGRVFHANDMRAAIRYARDSFAAACVKPEDGTRGIDVHPRCVGEHAIAAALHAVFARNAVAMVEESVTGLAYRIPWVAPRVMGARQNRIASVTGDGAASVRDLIAALNAERARRALSAFPGIPVHADMERHLCELGWSLDSVLPAGIRVPLSRLANFARDPGEGISVTDADLHPSYRDIAMRGFQALPGLKIAANDMIIADPLQAASADNCWVLEVNSSVPIDGFEEPWAGPSIPMSEAIIAMLQRDAAEAGASAPEPLDPHSVLLQQAAERAGIVTRVVEVGRPGTLKRPHLRFTVGRTEYDFRSGALRHVLPDNPSDPGLHINGEARTLATDKMRTKAALTAAGLSVPLGNVFGRRELTNALAFARLLSASVCVKPNAGKKGQRVFPDRRGDAAVAEAFRRVTERYDDVLVEESVAGDEIRFFYVEPHAVAVKMSVPPAIVGDGVHSVLDLVAMKNDTEVAVRLANQDPLRLSHALVVLLAEQGFDLTSVPEQGKRIRVGRTANGSAGSGHVECRDTIDPSYWTIAERAFTTIPGLVIGTLDMMVADRAAPAAPGTYWIMEINSSPGLLPYHHPWQGRPQDVGGAILEYLRRREAVGA